MPPLAGYGPGCEVQLLCSFVIESAFQVLCSNSPSQRTNLTQFFHPRLIIINVTDIQEHKVRPRKAVQEGAKGTVWAATLSDDSSNGGFFCDGKAVPW
jgi:hypothetical protein